MDELLFLSPAVSIITLVISLVFIIRWWRMTSDIKAIRKFLCKDDDEDIEPVGEETELEFNARVEKKKAIMGPNECIVKVLANSKLEVWDKQSWDERVSAGKSHFFELIYKNY